jgi:hypothetical protein
MADVTSGTGITRQIPRSEWTRYFERFTREQVGGEPPEVVTIEVLSPTSGDQFEAQTARLLGLSYDDKSSALEVLVEDLDHLVYYPAEIWVIEAEEGAPSTIAVVRADGSKEILYVHRGGPPALRYEDTFPPGG